MCFCFLFVVLKLRPKNCNIDKAHELAAMAGVLLAVVDWKIELFKFRLMNRIFIFPEFPHFLNMHMFHEKLSQYHFGMK